jgi:hypothetical protein
LQRPASRAAWGGPFCLDDRRDLGIGDVALPSLLVPVEDHPDAVVLGGVAEDDRALGPVLLALLRARGREDVHEAVEVLHLRRREQHFDLLSKRLTSAALRR